MADFFISYTSADSAWAEWIGFVLEEERFSVVVQAWDFRAGSNFVLEMQKAASEAERTILVLSPDYLKSQFASPEWAAAFARDPQGLERKLVPIMVRKCHPPGLLTSIVHISLVDIDEDRARRLLLDGVNTERAKPPRRPAFPGEAAHKSFPGHGSPKTAAQTSYVPKLKGTSNDADKRRFSRQAFDAIRAYFETSLNTLAQHSDFIEFDFQPNAAIEFTVEVFLNGKSACRCRVWLGGMFSSDAISYAEGQLRPGSNACNEILSVSDDRGDPYLTSLMGMGFGGQIASLDLKRLSTDQAAEYLWRRFVAPLER